MSEDILQIHCLNSRRIIQRHLNECREERRPYVFFTDTMNPTAEGGPTAKRSFSDSGLTGEDGLLGTILVPVSMLEEETYKAEICTYLARKTGAHIILLQAHDYGHKAQNNVNRIVTHIEQVKERTGEKITYEVVMAKKDSFHLMREAVERQREFKNELLVLTASRDYGLDDLLFGPPEQHAIARSSVPVMLVNPRADLFSLCD